MAAKREHWIKDRRSGKTACGRKFPVPGGATESIVTFDAATTPCRKCQYVLDGDKGTIHVNGGFARFGCRCSGCR